MKLIIQLVLIMFFASTAATFAQDSSKAATNKEGKVHKREFVDKNGDGYNDNAPDHDNDGIPNGLDPDFIKLKRKQKHKYVDLDGDGINDNAQINGNGLNKLWMRQKNKVEPQNKGNNSNNGAGSNQNSKKGNGKGKGGN